MDWISVKDRLPDIETNVLLHVTYQRGEYQEIAIGHLHQKSDFRRKPYFYWIGASHLFHPKVSDFHRVEYICPGTEYVTHWQPLPQLPLPTIDPIYDAGGCYCGECKHWHEDAEWCAFHSTFIDHNYEPCSPSESSNWKTFNKTDFCSYGEQRTKQIKSCDIEQGEDDKKCI